MKKTLSIVMAIVMVASLIASFGCVNASADSHYVSMYLSDMYYYRHSFISRHIYVKTDANAANQQVVIHYENGENQPWADEEAEFVDYLSDGSKLWKADVTSSGYCTDFAVKYVADGVTYWDNNNGQNYGDYNLGSAPITVERQGYPGAFSIGSTHTITANLQNYAYEKNVFLRYTNDGWNTYTDVPMSYDSTNDNGTENWKGTLEKTTESYEDFQFCVCYQANGQTYWANNFGQNYNAYFCVGR